MRQLHLLIYVVLFLFAGCTTNKNISKADKKIPGTYNYEHSWDYKAPDGNGTIHCDEQGTLRFYADGTYVDDAVQYHSLTLEETICVPKGWEGDSVILIGSGFRFLYHCEGRWKLENGKFLFNEMSEGFSMTLMDDNIWSQWVDEYAAKIVEHSTPNSDRWFTFDIERLDKKWFIWSYTYPNGRKDTWEMHCVKPNEAHFGEYK